MTYDKPQARLALPLLITLVAGTATILLWSALRQDQETRVANIVEAVSYAARSEMARQLIVQFRAFYGVRDYWARYALVPAEQWHADATIELDHFEGLDAIAWSERDGPRFFSSGPKIALGHSPSGEEWRVIQNWIDEAQEAGADTVAGPTIDDDGHAILRVYLPVHTTDRSGVLIAVIDIHDQIAAILEDESPGYDIRVSCCSDVELYNIGDFDADVPDEWKHGGLIEPMPDLLWQVDHQPSVELAATYRTWAIDTVLAVGLALSLAIGAITYHSRRADNRAAAARKAERELRVLNEQLEGRVESRTHALDQALSDLNTVNLSVAHDIRTPLNTANLTIESLYQPGQSDSEKKKVRRLEHSLDQISAILDRLLALSRVSAFAPKFSEINMQAMAERVVGELETNGFRSNIRVSSMPPAQADATMMHILLTNLIGNAVKHAGAGPIEIGSRQEDGSTVYFVRDHGPGLDPDEAEDLFTPQGESRSGESGLGLGLAIAGRAVSRHGGRIWAEPSDGGGATFCFSLAQPSGEDIPQ
jgi:signal transduction histidine kinase